MALGAANIIAPLLAAILIGVNARRSKRSPGEAPGHRRLADANRELEHLLDECTRELAQRTADFRYVSETVAHDLRNPLSTLGLNVHLLRAAVAEGDEELGRSAIGHVADAQRQMAEILDRLRRFSHVSFLELHRETVDMNALVREVFDELELDEPPPAVALHLADLPDCWADPRLVRILLLNLMGNALKYTRSRIDRWVEVGFEPDSRPPVYYLRDNGEGFDPSMAEELFEPFRSRAEAGGARTIGLAVAARVADRHGGTIWASSRPDQGATFHFRLTAEHVER